MRMQSYSHQSLNERIPRLDGVVGNTMECGPCMEIVCQVEPYMCVLYVQTGIWNSEVAYMLGLVNMKDENLFYFRHKAMKVQLAPRNCNVSRCWKNESEICSALAVP